MKYLLLHGQQTILSMVCVLERFILYLYRYECIINPKANRYDAMAPNLRYISLYLLFSNLEGRVSDHPNRIDHVSPYALVPYNTSIFWTEQSVFPLSGGKQT